MDPEVPGSSPGGGTISSSNSAAVWRSAHARYAAYAAAKSGYDFRSLDGEDGYLFSVSDGRRRATFAAGSGSPYALNTVRAAAIARDKFFCTIVLREAGLRVIETQMFFVTPRWREMRGPGREAADALAFARHAAFPLFCKPLDASNGLYAEVVEDVAALESYMNRVARDHFAMLVQPYLRGVEHRVFVLRGEPVFSYRKQNPVVVGDGARTLAALIEGLTNEPHAPPRRVAGRDAAGRRLDADAIPEKGARIVLEGPANRAAGGGVHGLCEGAAPPLAEVARRAADIVGLELAAVDVFDLSPAADLADLVVIEVNSNPMIGALEDAGRWDLIARIWSANIEAALR